MCDIFHIFLAFSMHGTCKQMHVMVSKLCQEHNFDNAVAKYHFVYLVVSHMITPSIKAAAPT